MQLPLLAVKAKVQQEGLDPNIMDKAPTDLIPLDGSGGASAPPAAGGGLGGLFGGGGLAGIKKSTGPKVTKKKLHWKPLASDQVKGSLWASDMSDDIEDLHMDEEEFKRLFVLSETPEDRAKADKAAKAAKEVKKVKVSLINMKRAQNAGGCTNLRGSDAHGDEVCLLSAPQHIYRISCSWP
jgi:hypothetical protein